MNLSHSLADVIVMAKITITIDNDKLKKHLDRTVDNVKKAVEVGVNNIMEVMQDESSDIIYDAPTSSWYVRTGNLGRNYNIDKSWSSNGTYTAILSNRSDYFTYVELPTGKYAPNGRQTPWAFKTADGEWHWSIGYEGRYSMSKTLDKYKDKIKPYLEEEINKVL